MLFLFRVGIERFEFQSLEWKNSCHQVALANMEQQNKQSTPQD